MRGTEQVGWAARLHGPWVWLASAAIGLSAGWLLAGAIPGSLDAAGNPVIEPWLVIPFAVLLLSIALMPFISERVWHRHFPDFSFGLGGLVAAYVLRAFHVSDGHGGMVGTHAVIHALEEFYSFVALVCGLYVVSGGILISIRGRATPTLNVVILGAGALLANLVGTTGASMLLLRPFMRLNEGRLRPIHIVLFIMIVSNCGGLLTPVGDPPLYIGFLKGVPFLWTLQHLWNEWLLVVGSLLAIAFVIDLRIGPKPAPDAAEPQQAGGTGLSISGTPGLICLALMVAGVFVDPVLKLRFGISGFPYGATFQLAVAAASYFVADREILEANQFSFFPAKEVSLLFLGIFVTMIPALGYLSVHGQKMGVDTPTAFYFMTGALSAVLDNAPTYVNFLQIAIGPEAITPTTIARLLAEEETGRHVLSGISSGAVLFGALTYIGNGPNFMVRSIADSAGVKMPSFFGYALYGVVILLPILLLNWLLFIR